MATKKRNYSSVVAALILFYTAEPYFIWHNFMGTIYVKTILAFIVGGLFYLNRRAWTNKEVGLFLLLLGTIILFPIVGGHNFNFFLPLFPLVFFPFARDSFSRDVYNSFLGLYVFFVGIALLFWLLTFTGLITPLGTIQPLNTLKPYNYNVYPFYVQANNYLLFPRFGGPFDEPGVIGTLSGILLCVEKFNLKDRRSVILLLSGLVSLSFFFYLLIAVYSVFYFAFQKRSFLRSITVVILFLGVYLIIQSVPVLRNVLGARFEWDFETGTFAGDNRYNYSLVEDYYNQIYGTNQFWFGVDDKISYLEAVSGSSSFISVIILNGMVFVLLYLLFFVLYSLYYRKQWSSVVLFLIVFIGTIYQRPNTFHMLYFFLFTYLARLDSISNSIGEAKIQQIKVFGNA